MLKKIGIITFVDLVVKGISFLIIPFYLFIMPKVEFGEFGFYYITLTQISLFLSLSLYISLIKVYNTKPKKINNIQLISNNLIFISSWLSIVIIIFIIFENSLISFITNFFGSSQHIKEKFYSSLFIIILGVLSLFIYAILIARNRVYEVALYIFLKFILTTIFAILFLTFEFKNFDTVLNRMIGIILGEILLIIIFVKFVILKYINFKFDKKSFVEQFMISAPLIPAGIFGLVNVIIDRKFILEFHGLADLASYHLAMQALMPIQSVMGAVQVTFAPYLFSINDKAKVFSETLKIMKWSFLFMILGVIFIIITVKILIYLKIINIKYEDVPLIILISSLGAMGIALNQLCNNIFIHLNKSIYQLIASTFTLIIFISLNYLLIKNYSNIGAASALSISNVLGLLLALHFLTKMK